MYAGTDRLKRWLVERETRDVVVRESATSIRLRGRGAMGEVSLRLGGITPNSLFTTGQFLPLVVRLDVGVAGDEAAKLVALRNVDGRLWQAVASRGARSAALCALEPLSPLHRLSFPSILRFLRWAGAFLVTDAARVASLASESLVETVSTMKLWERVSLQVKRAFADRRGAGDLRAQVGRALREAKLSLEVEEWSGGQSGPVALVGRFRAHGEAPALRLELDLFRVNRPTVSPALDDLLIDIRALESLALVAPPRFGVLRLSADHEAGLDGLERLYRVGRAPRYLGWFVGEDLETDRLSEFFVELGRVAGGGASGPYR